MPWRIVLRNHGSHICDGKLLGGIIFCCLRNCVFKLSCWLLSGLDGGGCVHSLSLGFLLRDFGSIGRYRFLCCRILLQLFSNDLLELFCWVLSIIDDVIELHELLVWLLFGCIGPNISLHFDLCSGQLLRRRSKHVYELRCGILSSNHRPIELHELFVWLFFGCNGPNIDLYFDL